MNDMQGELSRVHGLRFSTESLGAEKWREAVCTFFAGLSIDWVLEQPRPAWLGLRRFADVQIMEIASHRSVRVTSTPSPAGFTDTYNLALLAAGCCRSKHAGREEVWQTGDMMLFDSAQAFNVFHPGEYHLVSWNLPREAVAHMLDTPDCSLGVRIPGRHGPGAVLGNYVRTLLSESTRLEENAQRDLLSHLYGLIGLALGASSAAHGSHCEIKRAADCQRILSFIEANLYDPQLTVQSAANKLKISPRWLHALLEECEVTFAARVAQRRLEEAKKLLENPAYYHLTITDIAYQSGFGNISTFNRRFLAQYGMAPRDMRYLTQRRVSREEL